MPARFATSEFDATHRYPTSLPYKEGSAGCLADDGMRYVMAYSDEEAAAFPPFAVRDEPGELQCKDREGRWLLVHPMPITKLLPNGRG